MGTMNIKVVIHIIMLILLTLAVGCGSGSDSGSNQGQDFSDILKKNFAVSDSSTFEINNFAGGIDLVTGDAGFIQVLATKRALRAADLGKIEVEMTELGNGVKVVTSSPADVRNISVDLEITVPPDAWLEIKNGAGGISYEGSAQGECHFTTGAGTITLKLPADTNVDVYLAVGAGSVQVDFPVDGQVSENIVEGSIGTGGIGRIEARVGAGKINLIRK